MPDKDTDSGRRANKDEHAKADFKDRPVAHPTRPIDSKDDVKGGRNSDSDQ